MNFTYYSTSTDEVLEYSHRITVDDIIRYEFEAIYHTPYRDLGWWLEDGAKDLVKIIENAWLHNALDIDSYRHNNKFLEWLKENIYDQEDFMDAFREFIRSLETAKEYIEDDGNDEIEYEDDEDEKEHLKDQLEEKLIEIEEEIDWVEDLDYLLKEGEWSI